MSAELAEMQRKLAEAERRLVEEAAAREASDRRAEEAERRAAAAMATLSTETAAETTMVPETMEDVQKRFKKVTIGSPSKAKGNLRVFRPELSALLNERPLTLGVPLSSETLDKVFEAGVFGYDDASEAILYPLATHSVPTCVNAQLRTPGAKKNAEAVFGKRTSFELHERWTMPLNCEPEVYTKAKEKGDPAYTGEIKRLQPGIFNEGLTYTLLGLLFSAFFVDENLRGRRFHTAPPVGYVLLACGCLGFWLGVEWVGKLLAYPVSQPFFLGSREHEAEVAALPCTRLRMQDAVVVPYTGGSWLRYPAVGDAQVAWTAKAAAGGRFWKIIQSTAFDEHPEGGVARLRALHHAHARYAEARDAAPPHDPPPAALLPARLLYGAFELLVDLPFKGDREATAQELAAPGAVADAVAAAVAWLARSGLLYVDLRPPNVRVGGEAEAAWLVDYDDMELLEPPAQVADDVLRALAAHTHGARALDAFPALRDALQRTPWPAELRHPAQE